MDLAGVPAKCGLITLVSYVPDPLGSFLNTVIDQLHGNVRPHAHVTLLPPRPLRVSAEKVSEEIRAAVRHIPPFEVELGSVQRFSGTNLLYLDITEGSDKIHEIHRVLNRGSLAHSEEFEFNPHLTLSRCAAESDSELIQRQAQTVWNAVPCPKRFWVDHVVLLWFDSDGPSPEWHRLWTEPLRAPAHTLNGAKQ